ncbi:alkaline phosphatase family protein [Flavitalea flava]
MKNIALLFFFTPVFLFAQSDTTQKIVPGRVNSAEQQQKPYVILISADGFRYDLADKYQAVHLQELRDKGVAAGSMRPSYPTLTFPNHYSIATGLYPAHHGIVSNAFYDRQKNAVYRIADRKAVEDSSWYGGTPIWVLAEKQHLLSASFYWVGSEAAIQGIKPTYYYRFSTNIDIDTRIQAVKDWLTLPAETRPHLITFYLPQVDHEEHHHGVDSRETEQAVHLVDNCVAKMVRVVDSLHLPVNFIFLSDHGIADEDTVHNLPLPSVIDTAKFIIPVEEAVLNIYAKDKEDIQPTYKALKKMAVDFDVYLPGGTPKDWHYRTADDRYQRLGDIVLVSKFPKVFNINKRKPLAGMHGFDNALPDMQAIFYAWGPAFKENVKILPFDNVHVYPLIATILGLPVTEKIDGSPEVLHGILK